MDMSFEQKVRERAYEIWMAAGMSDGMAHEHWCAAEQDLTPATAEPKAARAKAPAKAKTAPAKAAAAKGAKTVAAKKATTKPATKAPTRAAKRSSGVSASLN